MVTCQSANQLKTPAKVSWAFKMFSQFGSLGDTITGKTADLTVVQKTIIDTLHKEDKPQTFIAKEAGCSQSAVSKHVNRKLSGRKKCGRKICTTDRENRSLIIITIIIVFFYIYIAHFWVLKALYIVRGNLLNHQCAASTWMMRRQPYCARTPTTHQLTDGEETEWWSQSVYGDD